MAAAVQGPDDLGVAERQHPVVGHAARDELPEAPAQLVPPVGPLLGGHPVAEQLGQLDEALARVADHGGREVLRRVEARRVQGHDPCVVVEEGPGPGDEVVEPGADGEHEVGRPARLVGLVRARDPHRPDVPRVVGDEGGLAGDGLHDRDAVPLREVGQLGLGEGVVHPAAGDEHRTLRAAQRLGGALELPAVGSRPRHAVHDRLEEALGVVVRRRGDVLGEAEEGRTAVGRVQQGAGHLRERGEELGGVADPVPVAHDRPEAVVDGGARVAEVLDLLEHGVGQARGERVARDEQGGDPVGHGDAGRRDHVRGPGTDRARRDHDLPAAGGLAEGDCCQAHALLGLAPPDGDLVAVLLQGVAQARDVAVAEDGEDTRVQGNLAAVDLGALGDEVAHERLGGGDADGAHRVLSLRSCTLCQLRDSHESMRACCTLTTSTACSKPGVKRSPVARASRNA